MAHCAIWLGAIISASDSHPASLISQLLRAAEGAELIMYLKEAGEYLNICQALQQRAGEKIAKVRYTL